MSAHWDWAIQQALSFYRASHFLYLTDRMMFRKRALREVVDLATAYPNKVISYSHDRIIDNLTPIRVEQYPASGSLFEVETMRLSWLLSQSAIIHPAVPRMLNCIVPRAVLNRVRKRFDTVFTSISPDFNFCCRCLEIEDSILFYDKAPIFHYAQSRSNGASVTRGELTADFVDFNKSFVAYNVIPNYATPIPELSTAVNYAFHEYCLFKQQTNSMKFFEIDFAHYLQANANEISQLIDPQVRADTLSLLIANGYREEQTNRRPKPSVVKFAKRVRSKTKRVFTGPATTSTWMFLGRSLGIRPPGYNGFEFATLAEAIDYVENISRGNVTKVSTPQELLGGRELPKQSRL